MITHQKAVYTSWLPAPPADASAVPSCGFPGFAGRFVGQRSRPRCHSHEGEARWRSRLVCKHRRCFRRLERRAGLQGRVDRDRARHPRRQPALRLGPADRAGVGRALRRAPLHRARGDPPGRAGRPAAAARGAPPVRGACRACRTSRRAPPACLLLQQTTFQELWELARLAGAAGRAPGGPAPEPQDLQQLHDNLAASDKAHDDATLVRLDVEFHALVGRASHNSALMLAREPVGLLYSPTLLQHLRPPAAGQGTQPRGAPAHRRGPGRARRRRCGRVDAQAHGRFSKGLRDGRAGHGHADRGAGFGSRQEQLQHRRHDMNERDSRAQAALAPGHRPALRTAPRRAGAGDLQARHRQLPVGPGGRELRHPGGQRRQGGDRRLQQGHGAGALQQGRLRRHEDRAGLRRRERRRHQAGAGAAQPLRPREGRRGGRLRGLGRLPGGGAGGRGDEEVPDPLRLRHAAHLRGQQVQLRVPHRLARGDGQRGAGALPEGAQRQGRHLQHDQPGLRLGPGLEEGLHLVDGEALPRRQGRARTCCPSSAPASTAPRSRR